MSEDDNERTTVTPGQGGASLPMDHGGSSLPLGHRLQEYVIEGLIGEGGFGIVYLARDTQLGRVVALKEYMPSSLALRGAGHEVSVRSARHRETFELGLRSFVNEAQLLASFDHPSLVKVYRFWEQNGTAYMVMPYYQGPTLKQWLIENGATPNETWLRGLLNQLIDALELMHHERCYHRDIAPDNVLLLQQAATQLGSPQALRAVLLDFGAARRVIGDATQALTVILKSGYAPIEQYAESTSMKQGAWTDVYALSAVMYAAITGKAPLPSVSRMVSDDLVPAQDIAAGRYSPQFLAAIDAGLAVRPDQRPQDMAALRALFSGSASRPMDLDLASAAPHSTPQRFDDTPITLNLGSGVGPTGGMSSATQAPPLPTVLLPPRPAPSPSTNTPPRVQAPPIKLPRDAPSPTPASRAPLWVGGGVAVVALATAGWWFGARDRVDDVPVAHGQASAVAATSGAASAATNAAVEEASAASASVAAAEVKTPPTPFTVVGALQDIVRGADPLLGVNALADKSTLTIGSDPLQFRLKASESGYVYVFLAGTDKSHLYLLFPNGIDKNNRIEVNRELVLPRAGWRITAGGPAGTDHIVAMVSRNPRDLTATGLRNAAEDIPEFDLARAEQLWAQRVGGANPLVGAPVCAAGAATCDSTYGATLLQIDEIDGKKAKAGGK
jgi:serine/threonine protein kinase